MTPRRRRRRPIRAPLRLAAAALLAGAACAPGELVSGLGVPTERTQASLQDVARHGPYLAATLSAPRWTLRFFFPVNADCERVLGVPGAVEFVRVGRVGEVVRGATRCEAVGLGSLEGWRDRSARPLAQVLPAGRGAEFVPVYVDADGSLLRGSFPQAARIGWVATGDMVVFVPRNPSCDEIARRGRGELRFHGSGFPAYTLSSDDVHCAVIGFAAPL